MPRQGFKVKITESGKGLGPIAKLFARDMHIKLGIFGNEGKAGHRSSEGGETVVEVMTKHEFGLDGNPERSFIRAWMDENQSLIRKDLRAVLKQAASGKGLTILKGLKLMGLKYEGLIKARMSRGIPPPNSAATVKRKGSSKPLIDTGQGRSAITNKVVNGKP